MPGESPLAPALPLQQIVHRPPPTAHRPLDANNRLANALRR